MLGMFFVVGSLTVIAGGGTVVKGS